MSQYLDGLRRHPRAIARSSGQCDHPQAAGFPQKTPDAFRTPTEPPQTPWTRRVRRPIHQLAAGRRVGRDPSSPALPRPPSPSQKPDQRGGPAALKRSIAGNRVSGRRPRGLPHDDSPAAPCPIAVSALHSHAHWPRARIIGSEKIFTLAGKAATAKSETLGEYTSRQAIHHQLQCPPHPLRHLAAFQMIVQFLRRLVPNDR
jgi:hypothetical protein